MTTKELIKVLEDIIKDYGDLPICSENGLEVTIEESKTVQTDLSTTAGNEKVLYIKKYVLIGNSV